jgi:hypothetical protein
MAILTIITLLTLGLAWRNPLSPQGRGSGRGSSKKTPRLIVSIDA